MIKIINDGQTIVESNYWTSELAEQGYYFLSLNAGAARLLLPPAMESAVPDMLKKTRHVVISKGFYNGLIILEIMFEDGTDSPYVLHMDTKGVDHMFSDNDKEFVFVFFFQAGWVADLPGYYRVVAKIPYLKSLNK